MDICLCPEKLATVDSDHMFCELKVVSDGTIIIFFSVLYPFARQHKKISKKFQMMDV